MTVLRIFNAAETEEPESVVYLRLQRSGNNVLLMACDEDGEIQKCGNLIKIYADGTYQKMASSRFAGKDFKARSK